MHRLADVPTLLRFCPHWADVEFNCSCTSGEPLGVLWNPSFAPRRVRNQQTAHWHRRFQVFSSRTGNLRLAGATLVGAAFLWGIIYHVIGFIVAALSIFLLAFSYATVQLRWLDGCMNGCLDVGRPSGPDKHIGIHYGVKRRTDSWEKCQIGVLLWFILKLLHLAENLNPVNFLSAFTPPPPPLLFCDPVPGV